MRNDGNANEEGVERDETREREREVRRQERQWSAREAVIEDWGVSNQLRIRGIMY